MFRRILIANRGEIAVRIARACREMDIESIGVFSDVDRQALHVRKVDRAFHIGPAQASESYLNTDKILEVARRSGAEAIHPGYGFLSENSKFAATCERAGIKFIGPSAHSMEMMGSKTRARQTMKKAGVPFVPGSEKGLENLDRALEFAEKIGYPVMLKAASGGGGKGMRQVRTADEMRSAFDLTRSEAQRAFGDNEVYIEKLIENPRHVEMQIMADEHGNVIHLGERECSIQRRHQKVLEEAPSPIVDEEMRRHMGEIAVRAARVAQYTNAGTVEFLVDPSRNFYFLEMNTRLQVEHPVTEMVTGLTWCKCKSRLPRAKSLRFARKISASTDTPLSAESTRKTPTTTIFPSPGRITRLISPAGPGIRRDGGIYEGWTIPIEYDPLLSKISAYGSNRTVAINRMRRALVEVFIGGIKTNISLFRRILLHPEFQAGTFDTGFLDRLLKEPKPVDERTRRRIPIAAIAAALFAQVESRGGPEISSLKSSRNGASREPLKKPVSNWKQSGGRRHCARAD